MEQETTDTPPKIPLSVIARSIITDRRFQRGGIVAGGFLFGCLLFFYYAQRSRELDMIEREERTEWLVSVRDILRSDITGRIGNSDETSKEVSRELDHALIGRKCMVHGAIREIIWIYFYEDDVWIGCVGSDGVIIENKALDVILYPVRMSAPLLEVQK